MFSKFSERWWLLVLAGSLHDGEVSRFLQTSTSNRVCFNGNNGSFFSVNNKLVASNTIKSVFKTVWLGRTFSYIPDKSPAKQLHDERTIKKGYTFSQESTAHLQYTEEHLNKRTNQTKYIMHHSSSTTIHQVTTRSTLSLQSLY